MEFLRNGSCLLGDAFEDAEVALVAGRAALLAGVDDFRALEPHGFRIFIEMEAFVDWVLPACRASPPDALTPVDDSVLGHDVAHEHALHVLVRDVF